MRRRDFHEAELSDFVKFMNEKTTLENDPLYSREAVNDLKDKRDPEMKKKVSTKIQGESNRYIQGMLVLHKQAQFERLSKKNETCSTHKSNSVLDVDKKSHGEEL